MLSRRVDAIDRADEHVYTVSCASVDCFGALRTRFDVSGVDAAYDYVDGEYTA